MHILRWIRMLLVVCGFMPPPSWSSPVKKFLYNIYTVFVLLIVHTLLISQILDVIFIVDNPEDFSDNFYITVAILVCSYKTSRFLINRDMHAILMDTLDREPFSPMNKEENQIREKFDRLSELSAMTYTTLVVCCVVLLSVTPFFGGLKDKKLICRAWIPYNYSSPPLFFLTIFHQVTSMAYGALLNVALDILFGSLLIHTYCQLEILEHRLTNIKKNENKLVKQCVRHHRKIYKLVFFLSLKSYAAMVNKEFKFIIGSQFLASLLIICFSLYRLTQEGIGLKFLETFSYTVCVLMEILYYCWYGNEVKLKSLQLSDKIFKSNWISLSNNTKKILLMIMRRATVPIDYTSIHVVSMDLESFMSLLKTSYSAYNMLKTTK
ncbi:odorant receptor 4-like [Calliopsis andreniformis]|uniref:odorant receptor 4-like n=1 Tax=Calliopsis andreniformis TaxID=337506 RepID=UPI003FCDE48C